jgi:hypothetical protein
MSVLVRLLAWSALTAYVALLMGLAVHGLLQASAPVLGPLLLAIALGCALLLKLSGPLRLAALWGALAWHWPWVLALLYVCPRWLTRLPGWINWTIARRRHPAPRWPSETARAVIER